MENNLKHTTGCQTQDQCRTLCLNHSCSALQPFSFFSSFLSSVFHTPEMFSGTTSKRQIKQRGLTLYWCYKLVQYISVNCRSEVICLGKGTKLMRQLLIWSYLEFCQQYWLHCRWDKISLEGTDDLHSKDKTLALQKHSTVILQLSRAQILQPRHNTGKTLYVCLCVNCICVC